MTCDMAAASQDEQSSLVPNKEQYVTNVASMFFWLKEEGTTRRMIYSRLVLVDALHVMQWQIEFSL